MESVILSSPFLMILYGVALLLSIIGIRKKGSIFASLSIIICLLTTGYILLKGATLHEAVVILLLFLAVNLNSFKDKGENK